MRTARVYQRSRLTRRGTPRKGWSAGTAWVAVVWDDDGTRREFYGPTEAAAEKKVGAWRRGELRPAKHGEPRKWDARAKASDCLARWAADPKHDAVWDVRRRKDVQDIIRLHVVPHWTTVGVGRLDRSHVQEVLDKLATKPTTQARLRSVLRMAFKDEQSLVSPTIVPRAPRTQQREDDQRPQTFRILTRAEWGQLEAAALADPDPVASACLVLLHTGMRSGELRALRWADYTPRDGTFHVRRTVTQRESIRGEQKGYLVQSVTKTKHSARPVDVTPLIQSVMEQHSTRETTTPNPNGISATRIPGNEELIWPALGRSGDPLHKYRERPLDKSRLSKVLERLRRSAGISEWRCTKCGREWSNAGERCPQCLMPMARLRVHDLRHSHCSALVAMGVPQPVILERMGWKGAAMLDRYAHGTVDEKRNAVEKLSHYSRQSDPADEPDETLNLREMFAKGPF